MHGIGWLGGVGDGVFLGEVVLVPEVFVEFAGELCGTRAKGGTAALEEEDGDQAALGPSE